MAKIAFIFKASLSSMGMISGVSPATLVGPSVTEPPEPRHPKMFMKAKAFLLRVLHGAKRL